MTTFVGHIGPAEGGGRESGVGVGVRVGLKMTTFAGHIGRAEGGGRGSAVRVRVRVRVGLKMTTFAGHIGRKLTSHRRGEHTTRRRNLAVSRRSYQKSGSRYIHRSYSYSCSYSYSYLCPYGAVPHNRTERLWNGADALSRSERRLSAPCRTIGRKDNVRAVGCTHPATSLWHQEDRHSQASMALRVTSNRSGRSKRSSFVTPFAAMR